MFVTSLEQYILTSNCQLYDNLSSFFLSIQDSRKTSLVHAIIDMFVTSLNETPDQEEDGHQDIEDHENRQRKRSFVQKFVEVLFYDEGDEIDQSSSQTQNEKSSQFNPEGDARKQMVLGLQKLDRDRKKSLLVRVIDTLLSRSDHSQQDVSTDSIEDHVIVDVENKEYATGENYSRKELHDMPRAYYRKKSNTEDSLKRELEVDQEDKPTSVSAKFRQRRSGIVSIKGDGQLGLPNFGFAHERSEEIEKECCSDTLGHRRQKRSVTLSVSEFPVQPLMNGDGGKDLQLDVSVEKPQTVEDRIQEDVEDGRNPSASGDKQQVLGLPDSSPIRQAKKRRPKIIKHWLRDPNLYKVCVYFSKKMVYFYSNSA